MVSLLVKVVTLFFYVYFSLISFGFWYIELYNIYEFSNQVVTNK